jgi:hypothetical protein
MPTPFLLNLAEITGQPIQKLEALWEKAKQIASKKLAENDEQYYPYVTGVLKNMVSLGFYADTSTSAAAAPTQRRRKKAKKGRKKTSAWWNSLTAKQQKAYLDRHPNSQFKNLPRKKKKKPGSAGPRANQQQTNTEQPENTENAQQAPSEEPSNEGSQQQTNQASVLKRIMSKSKEKISEVVNNHTKTIRHGVKGLAKLAKGQSIDPEERKALVATAHSLLTVALAATVALTPLAPYGVAIAQIYVEALEKAGKRGQDSDEEQPSTDDEDALESEIVSSEDTLGEDHTLERDLVEHATNFTSNMMDWLLSHDQNELIEKAKARSGINN